MATCIIRHAIAVLFSVALLAAQPTRIYSCQNIAVPGEYQVMVPISAASGPCLTVQSPDVSIQCNQNSIAGATGFPSVVAYDSDRLQISGCSLVGSLGIYGASPNVQINSNSITSPSETYIYSAGGNVGYNVFNGAGLIVVESAAANIHDNTFNAVPGTQYLQGMVKTYHSDNVQVLRNTIHGGWQVGDGVNGANDGISLMRCSGCLIEGNVIDGVFHSAVEISSAITTVTVRNNIADKYGSACIMGWHDLDVQGLTVTGNTCTSRLRPDFNSTPSLFWFVYAQSYEPWIPYPHFKNVTFSGNRLNLPDGGAPTDRLVYIDFAGALTVGNIHFGSNVFALPPAGVYHQSWWPYPDSTVIDDGGNVCRFANPWDDTGRMLPITCIENLGEWGSSEPLTLTRGNYYAIELWYKDGAGNYVLPITGTSGDLDRGMELNTINGHLWLTGIPRGSGFTVAATAPGGITNNFTVVVQ